MARWSPVVGFSIGVVGTFAPFAVSSCIVGRLVTRLTYIIVSSGKSKRSMSEIYNLIFRCMFLNT